MSAQSIFDGRTHARLGPMLLPTNEAENTSRITDLVGPLARDAHGRRVFLVDGDQTMTPHDTSRAFLRRAGGDPMVIKRRFEREGYCFNAFRFHAEVHIEFGQEAFTHWCPIVASEAVLHRGSVEFLRKAAEDAAVFIVSAGIPGIWRCIVEQHAIANVQVIGGIDPLLPYVFGRAEKAHVCRLFLDEADTVIGVGDSDVDAQMLQLSHHAVVVVNHHRNADLVPHLTGHASLWQVVPDGVPHPSIPQLDFPAVAALATGHPSRTAEAQQCP